MMDKHTDFVTWLAQMQSERNWKQADLARKSGVSTGYISQILNGVRSPGVEFCKSIARAFGVPAENVLRRAGLIDPDERSVAYSPAIRRVVELMLNMDDEAQGDCAAVVSAIGRRRTDPDWRP